MNSDSVSKIVGRYFAATTRVPFSYGGREYLPRPLSVGPLLLRGYTCPAGCGACCLKFSLDYLPDEPRPKGLAPRAVEFDGREVVVYSDLQPENSSNNCKHLSPEDGRCGVYEVRPFSCDFELIRTLEYDDRPNVLTQRLYGRGWNMMRVDGERGALCEMTPVNTETKREVVRKLGRLRQWADHFGIRTWADEICSLIQSGKLTRNVVLSDDKAPGFGAR